MFHVVSLRWLQGWIFIFALLLLKSAMVLAVSPVVSEGIALEPLRIWREPAAERLESNVRRYVEEKYQVELVSLVIVPIASGVIAARFDWQADWWGGMAILAVDGKGIVKYSYDMPEPLDAPTVINLRPIRLAQCDRPVVLAVGRTHMGNGMLSLYELFPGKARLMLSTRAVGNFPEARFTQGIADLVFADVDADGCDDLLVTVPVEINSPENPKLKRRTRYQRFFRGTSWGFQEDLTKARGTELFKDE